MDLDKEEAIQHLVDVLRPFQGAPATEDSIASERDQEIRSIVRAAMVKLGVYDAYGCPLCLG